MENSIINELFPEELITYQETFSFFDKDDSGMISIDNVSHFIRGLGHCPSEHEMKQMLSDFQGKGKTMVSFEELMEVVLRRNKEQCIEEEILEAFEGIQSYHGASSDGARNELIQVLAMKKTLCDAGEPLSEAQFDQFVEFLNSSGLKANEQDFNFKNLTKIMAYGFMEL